MNSFVLSTKGFPDRHTGVNISQEIIGILREYDIGNDQIEAIVHDQGANYELAVSILNHDFEWNELKCSGHCLQLCVNSGLSLSIIERMVAVGRQIVGHFHHSALATEALRQRQQQMQLPVKKLKQDVATRWNSTLSMLESLIVGLYQQYFQIQM
jgi:tRNA isopentenyl-2-thiomethyl-A-37 hydroxylase MiaE